MKFIIFVIVIILFAGISLAIPSEDFLSSQFTGLLQNPQTVKAMINRPGSASVQLGKQLATEMVLIKVTEEEPDAEKIVMLVRGDKFGFLEKTLEDEGKLEEAKKIGQIEQGLAWIQNPQGQTINLLLGEASEENPEAAKSFKNLYTVYQWVSVFGSDSNKVTTAAILEDLKKDLSIEGTFDEKNNLILKKDNEIIAVIPPEYKLELEGNNLIINNPEGSQKIIKFGDYEIKIEKGERAIYSEEEGISTLKLSQGDIKIGETNFDNLRGATFKVKNNQIEYAEFISTKPTIYNIPYNDKVFTFKNSEGSYVVFDPKNSKLSGENLELSYNGQEIKASQIHSLYWDKEGSISKLTMKGNYNDELHGIAFSSPEVFKIFFDGTDISRERTAVSINKNENTIQAKGFMKIEESHGIIFDAQAINSEFIYYINQEALDIKNGIIDVTKDDAKLTLQHKGKAILSGDIKPLKALKDIDLSIKHLDSKGNKAYALMDSNGDILYFNENSRIILNQAIQTTIPEEEFSKIVSAVNDLSAGNLVEAQQEFRKIILETTSLDVKSMSQVGLALAELTNTKNPNNLERTLQQLHLSLISNPNNQEAKSFQNQLQLNMLDVIKKTSAEERSELLDRFSEKLGIEGYEGGLWPSVKQVFGNTANIFLGTVGGKADKLNIAFEGNLFALDSLNSGITTYQAVLKSGYSLQEFHNADFEKRKEIISKSMKLTDNNIIEHFAYTSYNAEQNPDINLLIKDGIVGPSETNEFQFKKQETYITSEGLKKNWKDTITEQVNLVNTLYVLVPFSRVGGVTVLALPSKIPGVKQVASSLSKAESLVLKSEFLSKYFPTLRYIGVLGGEEIIEYGAGAIAGPEAELIVMALTGGPDPLDNIESALKIAKAMDAFEDKIPSVGAMHIAENVDELLTQGRYADAILESNRIKRFYKEFVDPKDAEGVSKILDNLIESVTPEIKVITRDGRTLTTRGYTKINQQNIDNIFQRDISLKLKALVESEGRDFPFVGELYNPKKPIYGAKAVAYEDQGGNINVLFLTETKDIHHINGLAKLLGRDPYKIRNDLKDIPDDILARSAGIQIQSQFDDMGNLKIIGIQWNSQLTMEQVKRDIGIPIERYDKINQKLVSVIEEVPQEVIDNIQIITHSDKKLNLK